MSGAAAGPGAMAWDGDDDQHLYEIKKARKSHTLSGRYLRALFVSAVKQRKTPVMLIHFDDADIIAVVRVVTGPVLSPGPDSGSR